MGRFGAGGLPKGSRCPELRRVKALLRWEDVVEDLKYTPVFLRLNLSDLI